MTDQEILQQYRNEKTRDKAFTALVNIYSKKMYLHVRRMVNNHDDANDVVQNAFVKIWKGLPNFREDAQLYTWLYRIATNEAITFINAKKRRNHVALDDGKQAVKETLKDEPWLDGDDTLHKLKCAIDALPAKQKQVFILRYYDEMKYEDIQQVLETSAGALKASFHHAVKKIEKFFAGN